MSFKFLRFRKARTTGPEVAGRVAGTDVGMAMIECANAPVESRRIKALARNRFERADRMMQRLAANDDEACPAPIVSHRLPLS